MFWIDDTRDSGLGPRAQGERERMAELNKVYSLAQLYDIAFGRSISREIDFLLALFRREAGRDATSLVDIACGPGYHARAAALRGIAATGVDLRQEMVDFARDEAEKEGARATWIAADMRAMALAKPVDIALTSYDSLDCLLTDEEILAHFRNVAANLAPDGLYVFEMTHPRDCSPFAYGGHRYAGTRDGTEVAIEWVDARPDLVAQVTEVKIKVTVKRNGAEEVLYDTAKERFCTAREYLGLARQSGALAPVGFWGDFADGQMFDSSPRSRRMIGVFRKAQPG